MNICIVGAGAIGGLFGTRLAAADEGRVSALARGATLEALRRHGWRLHEAGALLTAPALASEDARELGPQDIVMITLKAQVLPSLAPALRPLIGSHTVVLSAMNGVPWWFAHGRPELGGEPLATVDPGGITAAAIPFTHVLGGVVHAAASAPEPGVCEHRNGRGLILGEPTGGTSARAELVAARFSRAGLDVTVSPHVRSDIWYKLWGNLVVNPITALTGATSDRMLADPLVRAFASAAMLEAWEIGARIGVHIDQTPEDRHQVTARLGAFAVRCCRTPKQAAHSNSTRSWAPCANSQSAWTSRRRTSMHCLDSRGCMGVRTGSTPRRAEEPGRDANGCRPKPGTAPATLSPRRCASSSPRSASTMTRQRARRAPCRYRSPRARHCGR